MAKIYAFPNPQELIAALKGYLERGVPKDRLEVISPFPIEPVLELLEPRPSPIRFFSLFGALAGMLTGFAFTIYTSLSWPLITGGKPIVSIPPFVIIAFELAILFGALATFAGFLILSKLPSPSHLLLGKETPNGFVLIVKEEEK